MTNGLMSPVSKILPDFERTDLVRLKICDRTLFFSVCSPQQSHRNLQFFKSKCDTKGEKKTNVSLNVLVPRTGKFGVVQWSDVFTHERAPLQCGLCNPQILPVTARYTHFLLSTHSLLILCTLTQSFFCFSLQDARTATSPAALQQMRQGEKKKSSCKLSWAFSPPISSVFRAASWLAASLRRAVGNNNVMEGKEPQSSLTCSLCVCDYVVRWLIYSYTCWKTQGNIWLWKYYQVVTQGDPKCVQKYMNKYCQTIFGGI